MTHIRTVVATAPLTTGTSTFGIILHTVRNPGCPSLLTPGMLDRETVRRWRLASPGFDEQFLSSGWRALAAGVSVQRVRLMFDAWRWYLARQAPEFFGSGRTKARRDRARKSSKSRS